MNPYFKLVVFVVCSLFIVTNVGLADYTAADVATWVKFDWFKLSIGIGAALALQVLGFMDQSLTRYREEKRNRTSKAKHETAPA